MGKRAGRGGGAVPAAVLLGPKTARTYAHSHSHAPREVLGELGLGPRAHDLVHLVHGKSNVAIVLQEKLHLLLFHGTPPRA